MADEIGPDIFVTAMRAYQELKPTEYHSGNYYLRFSSTLNTQEDYFNTLLQGEYVVTQDVPAPTDDSGDIIVEATPDQVAAAKIAFEKAGINLTVAQVLSVTAAAFYSSSAAIATFAAGDKLIDIYRNEILNGYADFLYYQDGADGIYDGIASKYNAFAGFENEHFDPRSKKPRVPMEAPISAALAEGDFATNGHTFDWHL